MRADNLRNVSSIKNLLPDYRNNINNRSDKQAVDDRFARLLAEKEKQNK